MRKVYKNNYLVRNNILPTKKGGTSSFTPIEATDTLNVLSKSSLNKPLGPVSLGTDYKIKPNVLSEDLYDPSSHLDDGAINGPRRIRYDTLFYYKITDYNETSEYSVNCSMGTVSREAGSDTISYIWPSMLLNLSGTPLIGFSVNDRFVKLSPVTDVIETPKITEPIFNSSSVGEGGAFLRSSLFNVINGNTLHQSSDWEIYSDERMVNLFWSSYKDTNNKTTIKADCQLADGVSYWCRVRHHGDDDLVYSEWSNLSKFNVVYIRINKPVLVLPQADSDGKRIIEQTELPVSTSTMTVISGAAEHIATQFYVYGDNGKLLKITEGSFSGTNKNVFKIVSSFGVNTKIYFEFRYITSIYGSYSPWSDLYEFTTKDNIVGPSTMVSPLNLSVDAPRQNIKLISSISPSFPLSGQHTKTDWELSDNLSFMTTVFSSYNDAINLENITVPGPFFADKTLYARCRYFDSGTNLWGNWSNINQFKTANIPIVKPFILDPLNNQSFISLKEITIKSSNFSIENNIDTHGSTDWEITDSLGNVINSVYADAVNKTSLTMQIADIPDKYRLRLRYRSKDFQAVSPWSDDFFYNITGKIYNEKLLLNGNENDVSVTGNVTISTTGGKPGSSVTISLYDDFDAPISLAADSQTVKAILDDNGNANAIAVIAPTIVPQSLAKVKAIFSHNNHVRKSTITLNYTPILKMNGVQDYITTKDNVVFDLASGKPKGKYSYSLLGTTDPTIKYGEFMLDGTSKGFYTLAFADTVNSPITITINPIYDDKTIKGTIVNDRPNYISGDLNFVIDGDPLKDFIYDGTPFSVQIKNGLNTAQCKLFMFEPQGFSSWDNNAGNSKLFGTDGTVTFTPLKTMYGNTIPSQFTIKGEGSEYDTVTAQYLPSLRLVGSKIIRVLPKLEETGNEKLVINTDVSTKSIASVTNLNAYTGFTFTVSGVKPNTPIQISCDSLSAFSSPFNATVDASGKYTATLTTDKVTALTNTVISVKILYLTPVTIRHNLVISQYNVSAPTTPTTPTAPNTNGTLTLYSMPNQTPTAIFTMAASITSLDVSKLNSITASSSGNYKISSTASFAKSGSSSPEVAVYASNNLSSPISGLNFFTPVAPDNSLYTSFYVPSSQASYYPLVIRYTYTDFSTGLQTSMFCRIDSAGTAPPPTVTTYSPIVTFNGATNGSSITLNTNTDINITVTAGSPADSVTVSVLTSTSSTAALTRSFSLDNGGSGNNIIKYTDISSYGTNLAVVVTLTKGTTTRFSSNYIFSNPVVKPTINLSIGPTIFTVDNNAVFNTYPWELSDTNVLFGPPGGTFTIKLISVPAAISSMWTSRWSLPRTVGSGTLMAGGSFFSKTDKAFFEWLNTAGSSPYDYYDSPLNGMTPNYPFNSFSSFVVDGIFKYIVEFSNGDIIPVNINYQALPNFELKVVNSLGKLDSKYDFNIPVNGLFKPSVVLAGPLADSLQAAYGNGNTQIVPLPTVSYPILRQFVVYIDLYTSTNGVPTFLLRAKPVLVSGKLVEIPSGIYQVNGMIDNSVNKRYFPIPMTAVYNSVSLKPNTTYYISIATTETLLKGKPTIGEVSFTTSA